MTYFPQVQYCLQTIQMDANLFKKTNVEVYLVYFSSQLLLIS